MSPTTTLEVDGAHITVDTAALFRAWFEKHLGKIEAPLCACPMPRQGERYLGSIIEPNGRLRHTFLLTGQVEMDWNDAMNWAQSIKGDLPDRIEQAMFFAFMPEEFQKAAYWSNTQHAGSSNYAWYQSFGYGDQDYYYKSSKLCARAVRREFSDSTI